MALFKIDVEKRLGSEFWSNVYTMQSANFAGAVAAGPAVATFERGFHDDSVLFTRVRVSALAPDDEQYIIIPINLFGQRANDSTLLPLFNTLRIDMQASSGRPSRKFYRGVLVEDDISGDAVTFNFATAVNGIEALFAPDTVEGGIVDPQGQLLTEATQHAFVQMRQLRRSRRRRTNGGGIFQ